MPKEGNDAVKEALIRRPLAFEILRELQNAGSEITLTELASRSKRKLPTVHSALQELERLGLVDKQEETGKREKLYRITKRGLEVAGDEELKSKISWTLYRLRAPSFSLMRDMMEGLRSELARQGARVLKSNSSVKTPFGMIEQDLLLEAKGGKPFAVNVRRRKLGDNPLSLVGETLALSKFGDYAGVLYVLLTPRETRRSPTEFDEWGARDFLKSSVGRLKADLLVIPIDDADLLNESFVRQLAESIRQRAEAIAL